MRTASRPLVPSLLAVALAAPLVGAQQETKLVPLDAVTSDWAGGSVALSGDTALVGAFGDDDQGILSGSAYVFDRAGGAWSQTTKLRASDGATGARFGWSAALEGDTAVVGALYGNGAASVSGAAYVFTREAGSWGEVAKLSGGATSDWFGYAVALSGDTAAVGAPQRDDLGADSGAVYVYDRAGAVWNLTAVLHADDTAAGDHFGEALALVGDRLVVGAPEDADAGAYSGSAYVFDRVGGAWTQSAKLVASDAAGMAWFGQAVHTDGLRVAVGAYQGDDPTAGVDVGSAYVFTASGGGWSEEARLVASDAVSGDHFGWSVRLEGDRLLVGADVRVGRTGAVYAFRRAGGSWNEQGTYTASDATLVNDYGWALAGEAGTVLVGARSASSPHGQTGAVYVLEPAAVGTPRCFCDAAHAPCGNPDPAAGCANSTGAGALLAAFGSASAADQGLDPLVLRASGARPDKSCVWLQGATQQQALFRDGNLCVGNPTLRLPGFGCGPFPIGTLDASGAIATDDPLYGFDVLAAALCKGDDIAAAAPTTRDYQLWFRDGMGPCGTGSNLTNAVSVDWLP